MKAIVALRTAKANYECSSCGGVIRKGDKQLRVHDVVTRDGKPEKRNYSFHARDECVNKIKNPYVRRRVLEAFGRVERSGRGRPENTFETINIGKGRNTTLPTKIFTKAGLSGKVKLEIKENMVVIHKGSVLDACKEWGISKEEAVRQLSEEDQGG